MTDALPLYWQTMDSVSGRGENPHWR